MPVSGCGGALPGMWVIAYAWLALIGHMTPQGAICFKSDADV
jgi:hypothetical protein